MIAGSWHTRKPIHRAAPPTVISSRKKQDRPSGIFAVFHWRVSQIRPVDFPIVEAANRLCGSWSS